MAKLLAFEFLGMAPLALASDRPCLRATTEERLRRLEQLARVHPLKAAVVDQLLDHFLKEGTTGGVIPPARQRRRR